MSSKHSTVPASASSRISTFEDHTSSPSLNSRPAKLDKAQTDFVYSPAASGCLFEFSTSPQPWDLDASAFYPDFSFDCFLSTSPSHPPPPPAQEQAQLFPYQSDVDLSSTYAHQQLHIPHQQAHTFNLQHQLAYPVPLQQPSFQVQSPNTIQPPYARSKQQDRSFTCWNLPLNQEDSIAPTSTSRLVRPSYSPSSHGHGCDEAFLTYSSNPSTFGTGYRQVNPPGLPPYIDVGLLEEDGYKIGVVSAVEARLDENDRALETPGFEGGSAAAELRSRSKRRSSELTVNYMEDVLEEDEDLENPQSEDNAIGSPTSSSSTTSPSYHGRPRYLAIISTTSKRGTKPGAKSNWDLSTPNGHLPTSSPTTPLPTHQAKLSPSSSILTSDFLSLPPLPEDFNSYGAGGTSRFKGEDDHSGGVVIPDFSGRKDCWGIGKEAYQKLSAKAKKQLRNKLGARRFRERRKEYITTLEDRIAGRDELITETRCRLVKSIGAVNKLQAQIAALERAESP